MRRLRPGVEVESDFNRLEVRLTQRPLARWAYALTAAAFPSMLASMLVFGVIGTPGPVVVLFSLLAVALAIQAVAVPARLTVLPSALSIDAWTGRWLWARRRSHRLPLVGLELVGEVHVLIGRGVDLRRLTLRAGDGTVVRVGGIACSEAELDQLVEALRGAQRDALARDGDGEAEVPAALRAIQGVPRQVPD